MVAVSGLSGLRNAYRSVLSAVGSSEISGASRWLDALLVLGARRPTNTASRAAAAATRRMGAYLFIALLPLSRRRPGSLSRVLHVAVVARSFALTWQAVRTACRILASDEVRFTCFPSGR